MSSNFEFWNDSNTPLHPVSAPDFLPRRRLEQMQLHRLQVSIARAYECVPLMRQRMDEAGVKPADLQSLADLAKFPFTCKKDLRDTYPTGLFASPLNDIVRLHASSGTTGKPIVVAYTKNDLKVWDNVVARALASAGIRSGDILQNGYGYGLFTGGLGLHGGAESLGCTVIPIGGGNTERQIMFLKDFGVTAISSTPSYFLHIIEEAQKRGFDFRKDFKLRVGVFGAEPWTEEMRKRIEAATGIKTFDIYGLSEIIGPGVAAECSAQCGPHIFEDHFYPEIINPDTGEVLPEGETGELVFTTLSKEAMPMIRYRTRDLSRLTSAPCACGRTLRRIERISARSDDMLIIRGVNLFPSQIETALMRLEGTMPQYMIYVDRVHDQDVIEVKVELTPERFSDAVKSLETLRKQAMQAIHEITGLHIPVTLVEPNSLPRSEGKAKRVIDNRKK